MSVSDEEKALVPIEERQVDFYGDDLTAALARVEGGHYLYSPAADL